MASLEQSKLKKLVYKNKDFELHLEKEGANPPLRPQRTVAEPVSESAFQSDVPQKGDHRGGSIRTEALDSPGTYVTSPMVGTFYSSPAPDQPAFVKIGDKVSENTIVCIIEAMKVMNEVKAGVSGTVAEILAENSQPVEFGSRLLRIV